MEQAEVLIAGAGPTGLSAALFLAKKGIRSRIIDKAPRPSVHSKAFGVNARTLHLLEKTGLTERFLSNGHKVEALNLWYKGRRLFRNNFSNASHPYPFMLIQSQADTEAFLTQALAEEGIEVEWNMALAEIALNTDHVISYLQPQEGSSERFTTGYVLGADGAHSQLRKQLDIKFPGSDEEESWKLIDIELKHFPFSGRDAHAFMLDSGILFMIRIEEHTWRAVGNRQDLLSALPAGTKTGDIQWESDFSISHRRAKHFKDGHVFLAGDAAHVHSPIGARGMNLGIEDAYVFAELLAHGQLDQYEKLRKPVAETLIQQVKRLTGIVGGNTLPGKMARYCAPVLPFFLPLLRGRLQSFAMGLDHDLHLPA